MAPLVACDDGEAAVDDATLEDATVAPDQGNETGLDAQPDAAPRDAAAPDLGPDAADLALDAEPDAAAVDATPPDAEAPDAEPPPVAATRLDLASARIEGTFERLADGALLLDPGAQVVFAAVPPGEHPAPALFLDAAAWRLEDTAVRVRWGGGAAEQVVEGHTAHDAMARFEPLRADAPFDGFGVGARAPVLRLRPPPDAAELRIEVLGGGLRLYGVALGHPALPPQDRPAPPTPDSAEATAGATELTPTPCAEPDCDDGAALTALLAEAPEGPLVVRLGDAPYTLRTPWTIRRPGVTIIGGAGELGWDPVNDAQNAAVDVRGGGPTGPEYGMVGAVTADARVIQVFAPADFAPTYLRLTSDPYGEIAEGCINGRDREYPIRHVTHLARVLSAVPAAPQGEREVLTVTLDRGIGIDLPEASAPRVQAVDLLADFAAVDLRLRANCPETVGAEGYAAAACTNRNVLDDDGLALRWTRNAHLLRTSVTAFGAFGHRVDQALETWIEGLQSADCANFGDGGRGYGLHLIGANRSWVHAAHTRRTRHGLVVDFGSSDSQLLGADLARSSSYAVDIHGEASRDTLVRDNLIVAVGSGIVAGGGGNMEHCDDGPRHHVLSNTLTDASRALVAADATGAVYFEGNHISGGLSALSVLTDAGPVWALGNRIEGTRAAPFVVVGAGPLHADRNLFVDRCDRAAALLESQADITWGADNRYCPPAE